MADESPRINEMDTKLGKYFQEHNMTDNYYPKGESNPGIFASGCEVPWLHFCFLGNIDAIFAVCTSSGIWL